MKAFKKWLKTIALFFISIMMFQSCVAYQSASVSLEQAVREQKRTKINTIPNDTFYFRQIVFEEGQFYGLKKVKGETVKIPIDNNEVYKVFIQSKNKSTWGTIAIIGGALVIPVIILALTITPDLSGGFGY